MSVSALEMTELRWHSRGGQGGKTASKLLAEACFREGKQATAFSFYGAERRGAPVTSYNRVSDREIKLYSGVTHPDYVIVLDASLVDIESVTDGLDSDGTVVINSRDPSVVDFAGRIAYVDATEIADDYGLQADGTPIVNTPILGTVARTELVSIETVSNVIAAEFGETNADAAREAFDRTTVLNEDDSNSMDSDPESANNATESAHSSNTPEGGEGDSRR